MELKDVLGEIEADGANLVHGRLLEWALTPPLWHAEAVGGVHTIRPLFVLRVGRHDLGNEPAHACATQTAPLAAHHPRWPADRLGVQLRDHPCEPAALHRPTGAG